MAFIELDSGEIINTRFIKKITIVEGNSVRGDPYSYTKNYYMLMDGNDELIYISSSDYNNIRNLCK